jgi:beta-glucosidase
MDLCYGDENLAAVMQCWYPGALGGTAVAQVLFGEASPQGKLPVTFYRTTEELPEFTDYSMQNRTYRYMKNEALYPFGFGLTYSDYEITDVKTDNDKITDSGVTVTLTVKNTGKREITETLQAYVRYENGGVVYPNYQLKHFEKISLAAGEQREVKFTLPCGAFSLADEEGEFRVNPGKYTVYVGCSQPDKRSVCLTGKEPCRIVVSK